MPHEYPTVLYLSRGSSHALHTLHSDSHSVPSLISTYAFLWTLQRTCLLTTALCTHARTNARTHAGKHPAIELKQERAALGESVIIYMVTERYVSRDV